MVSGTAPTAPEAALPPVPSDVVHVDVDETVDDALQSPAGSLLAGMEEQYALSPRWAHSPFAWVKRILPAQKGRVGERLFGDLARAADLTVIGRDSTEHDCRVNGHRVEVKLSTSYDTADPALATVKWLQLRPQHDYAIVALLAICPTHVHLWLVSKKTALRHSTGQHGGQDAVETRQVEVDPDNPPRWLGPDVANDAEKLHRRFEQLTNPRSARHHR